MRKLIKVGALFALVVALGLSQATSAQSDSVVVLPTVPSVPTVDATVQLPGIQVGDLTVLGPSSANATATIDTNGLATDVFIEYGADGVLGLRTPKLSIAAGVDLANVLVNLLGLEPGKTISYRIVAENSSGTATSPTLTFTTPPASGGKNTATVVYVDLATGNVVTGAGALGKRTARCTIVGTSHRDTLRGTSRKDVICGLGGNDRIRGRGGNDVIIGGPGRDYENGGGGRDRLYGNAGNDRLVSRDKKLGERLNGGSGRDRATVDRGDRLVSIEKAVRK